MRQRQCRRAALTDGKQNFEEILRSPILITVSRGERQGCCRECSRFFTVTVIFGGYRFSCVSPAGKLSFVSHYKSIYKQAYCSTENFVDQICDCSAEVGGKL